MKARELQENLVNDTERFSSEEEHQRAVEALSKNLDAVKQSILKDSKIVKKALAVSMLKYIPKMNDKSFLEKVLTLTQRDTVCFLYENSTALAGEPYSVF